MIDGEPNSGKTVSLLTFPTPSLVMSYPGEGGYDSLPANDPNVTVLVWATDKLTVKPDSTQVIREVEKATVEALKTPGLQTFCGDGLHKLMAYAMDALSGGAFFEGLETKTATGQNADVLDPRVFGQAERWLFGYLNTVKQSSVPYVVFTCWDADKQERKAQKAKGEKWSDIPTKRLPALFGQTAKNIMGEFSVVVHASKGTIDSTKTPPLRGYRWQTKADGDVWGCGVKGPVEVVEKIPKFVEAKWPALASYLGLSAS